MAPNNLEQLSEATRVAFFDLGRSGDSAAQAAPALRVTEAAITAVHAATSTRTLKPVPASDGRRVH